MMSRRRRKKIKKKGRRKRGGGETGLVTAPRLARPRNYQIWSTLAAHTPLDPSSLLFLNLHSLLTVLLTLFDFFFSKFVDVFITQQLTKLLTETRQSSESCFFFDKLFTQSSLTALVTPAILLQQYSYVIQLIATQCLFQHSNYSCRKQPTSL